MYQLSQSYKRRKYTMCGVDREVYRRGVMHVHVHWAIVLPFSDD